MYPYIYNTPVMYSDPSGHSFVALLVTSMIFGAILGGVIMGAATGAALALGGAAGLASTGATINGFGLSTAAAFGIAVAATTVGGLASYSLDIAGSQTQQWSWGGFALAGFEGGLQGAATFGIAYMGGTHGLFNGAGNFGSPSDFFIKLVAQKGSMGSVTSFFYGASMLIGETGARFVFVSGVGFVARWIIDKIIYGV